MYWWNFGWYNFISDNQNDDSLLGLTIGLMTLDEVNLELLAKCGSAEDRVYASKIIPIRKDGYFLLVSLLLANTVI